MVREIVEVVLCTSFVIAYCEWLTLVCNVTFFPKYRMKALYKQLEMAENEADIAIVEKKLQSCKLRFPREIRDALKRREQLTIEKIARLAKEHE